jgi:hypothetical protein
MTALVKRGTATAANTPAMLMTMSISRSVKPRWFENRLFL